ncbi:MAG TPA: translation elongation factor Ts [Steroidobacteraceae bacterium]|nr:translation elongation factor Ts [Steroidobacteraceae bacterium]
MNITADAVKQLRERTGAGMMECKKALVETQGNLDAAAELMRRQGLAKADKKAARVAAEGVIVVERAADGRAAAMVEVNCETDFVAREADFRAFSQAVAAQALAARPASLAALLAQKLDSGETVDERRRALVAKIGENIGVRRYALLSSSGAVAAYVHGTRIGALVALEGGSAPLAHDVAMHVAASSPKYLSQADVPAEAVAKEREILTEQARGEGKAPEIVAKMVEGRLRKSLGEITLLGQAFVKEPDLTVEKLLKNAKATVTAFERFEVGAGIEKKQEDFVAEVMKQVKSSQDKPEEQDQPDGQDEPGGPGGPGKH